MRKDMARLIVKGHSSSKDRSNHREKVRDIEDLPEREPIRQVRRLCDYEGPRDRLNPLFNFLKENVGKRWDKVLAEICAVTDQRSFEGKHLIEHIHDMVIPESELRARLSHRNNWRGHYWEFYEDYSGVLRRYGGRDYKYIPSHNPDECTIGGKPYIRINNCWFEASYHEIDEYHWQYDPKVGKNLYVQKRVVRRTRQLNKKELKALGLSNEPGWKWYEKAA